jgi:hypothetical protein
MANTAFGHDATLTTPGSTTDTALVRWANTSGTSLNNTINILSDGSNITLNARGEVRFSDADSSHYIAFESPATVGTSYTMTLPADLPAADEVLTVTSYSSGAGVLEWAAAGGGGTAVAGTTDNGILTFVNSGSTFAAESTLTYTGTVLTVNAAGGTPQIQAITTATSGVAVAFQAKMAASSTDNSAGFDFIEGSGNGDAGNMAYHFIMTQRGGALTASDLTLTSENVDGSSNAGTVIKIADGTGAVNKPTTPCVMAYNSAHDTGVTGASAQIVIDLDTEKFDQGNNFASDTFTAPVFGRYLLNGHLTFQSITASATGSQAIFTTSNGQHTLQSGGGALRCANNQIGLSIGIIADMDANDTVTMQGSVVGESSNSVVAVRGGNTATVFSVTLIA